MNKVKLLVDKFKPFFNDSIPELSKEMGIHRSTLHQAMRRNRITTKLQTLFYSLAKKYGIELKTSDLIN